MDRNLCILFALIIEKPTVQTFYLSVFARFPLCLPKSSFHVEVVTYKSVVFVYASFVCVYTCGLEPGRLELVEEEEVKALAAVQLGSV